MATSVPAPADQSRQCRRFPGIGALVVLAALAGWHGWMTLSLFGSESPWEQLCNDQPILSGRHPANLYLGMLAARARLATHSGCCYDPAFQAGYPRTPIFNGGRLSELFLLAAGGEYDPRAYKIGLAA